MINVNTIYNQNIWDLINSIPDNYFDCIVTSPPYWKQRDYKNSNQIGQEDDFREYINNLTYIFSIMRSKLKKSGNLFLNMGDGYSSNGKTMSRTGRIKRKDLLLMPHRLAIAMQEDGWWIRMDNVWNKTNCVPSSMKDRTTRSHEYMFHMTKSDKYWYNQDAIREPHLTNDNRPINSRMKEYRGKMDADDISESVSSPRARLTRGEKYDRSKYYHPKGKNKRSVWNIPTQSLKENHFATFPEALVRICLSSGCPKQVCSECNAPYVMIDDAWIKKCSCVSSEHHPGIVFDPFMGSGTTAVVARKLGLDYVGCEINPSYVTIAENRINEVSI
jgi:DNA modification methylase